MEKIVKYGLTAVIVVIGLVVAMLLYQNMGVVTNDPAAKCAQEKTDPGKDECYFQLAQDSKNLTYCEDISNNIRREQCFG
ncbi:MAG TPA: hypothetical protein VJI13_00040 [Candidatus Norongarragalinales archaeon]|nr:hypothetical protein [Candidatus Norongarragalinales archaeon]